MKTKTKHYAALAASTLGLAGLSFASGFGDEKYVYDASGNLLEKQIGDQVTRYDYSGNQLNGSESDSTRKQYAYDFSGRLTSDSEAGKPTRKMEHQYLDKVTKVQTGDRTTEFFYNAEGQLVSTNTAGNSETFAWDGLAMVNRCEQLYVNEAHAVGGVPAIVGNDVAVSDSLGTSLSVGRGSFESTAYGEGLAEGLFTGKPFIEHLDVFLFKYRNYSAGAARWITPDPSGFPDGNNNYRYARDPLKEYDPDGLIVIGASKGIGNPVPTGNAHYSKTIAGVTYTYKVTFEGFDGATDDSSVTDLVLLRNPVITPYPAHVVIPAAVRADIALYYKQNCHGYTLGVDGWLNLDGNIDSVFMGDGYVETEDKDEKAKVVTYSTAHSGKATHWTTPDGEVATISHIDTDKHKIGTSSAHIPAGYDSPKYWEK